MKDFKDKVAVITEAASGIGFDIAKRAVMEGMIVVIADIEEESLISAENELRKMGDHIVAVHNDVPKANDMANLAQKTIDIYGEVHLLFNIAGVTLLNRFTWEHIIYDWEWIMGVNLWGCYSWYSNICTNYVSSELRFYHSIHGFWVLSAFFLIALTIVGHVSGGKLCPIPSIINNSAPGMEFAISFPPVTGTSGSSPP